MLAKPVPNTFKNSAELAAAISDETGTGPLVLANSPTIVAPIIASIIGNKISPAADSTTAIQILKADGTTSVMTVDTTNKRIGINISDPVATFELSGETNMLGILRVTQRLTGAVAYGLDIGLDGTTGSPVFSGIYNNTLVESFRIDRQTGKIGVGGVLVPTARLHLPAGTTVAATAPFKFTLSGASILTAAEAGVVEPDSVGNLYMTNASAKRKPLNQQYVLASLIGADFNVTTDQSITIPAGRWIVRKIVVSNASISLTTAAGGIYTAASKGGTAIVAAAQVYSALTASGKFVDLTLAAGMATDILTATTIYFSLTTAQGAAATGDIFIIGDRLDF